MRDGVEDQDAVELMGLSLKKWKHMHEVRESYQVREGCGVRESCGVRGLWGQIGLSAKPAKQIARFTLACTSFFL